MASGFFSQRCLAVALVLAVFLSNAPLSSPRPDPPTPCPTDDGDINYSPELLAFLVLLPVIVVGVGFIVLGFVETRLRPRTTLLLTVALSDEAGKVGSALSDIFSINKISDSQTEILKGTVRALLKYQSSFISGSLFSEVECSNAFGCPRETLRKRMRKEMEKLNKGLDNHQLQLNLASKQRNAKTLVTLLVVAEGAPNRLPSNKNSQVTKEAVEECLNYFDTKATKIKEADVIWAYSSSSMQELSETCSDLNDMLV